MNNEKIPYPPEATGEEQAIEFLMLLAKGATIPVPIASFVVDIIDRLYKRPIESRRIQWMEQVTEAINTLVSQQQGLTPSKLAENEEFVTILHRASELAVKTHQEQKRTLLKNAIISAGSPTAPNLDKQIFFLRTIDELTVNQVIVLSFYDDPRNWFESRHITRPEYFSAPRSAILEHAYPKIANDPFFNELVVTELDRRSLVSDIKGVALHDTIYGSITTKLGKEFLDYVKAETIEEDEAAA